MFPYLLLIFIVMSWVSLQEAAVKRKSVFVTLIILVAFSAVRNYTVGSDSPAYTYPFRQNIDPNTLNYDIRLELGYQYLQRQILSFTHEYYIFFAVMTLIATLPILLTIKNKSINFKLSLFIYLTFGFYFNIFNPERQSIAMAISFYALPYLFDKKIVKFTLLIILASTFHISAWIMIPIYFVCHANIRDHYKVVACFLASYLGSALLISYLSQSNDRYLQYTEQIADGGQGRLTLYLNILLAASMYLYGAIDKNLGNTFMKCRLIYASGVAILIPIAMLSTDPSGPQRILGYFSYTLMLMIPIILMKIRTPIVVYSFIVVGLIYYMLIVYNLGGIYPYKLNEFFEII